MAQSSRKSTPASDFRNNFGRYKDEAIAIGAVEVSFNGRPVGAYLSQIEYEHYLALKRRETKIHSINDMPDDILGEIENTEYGVVTE